MPLAALSHVSFRYQDLTVLDDVTLSVERGRKIGVIGQNGTGKSTLLRLFSGDLVPTLGEVFRQRGTRIAHQAQELTYEPGATVLDEMRRVFREDLDRGKRMRELEHALADDPDPAEQRRLLGEYERHQAAHLAAGGYDVERRIERVLSSLGLPEEAWHQPVERFSGGERNIIGLASVLLSAPDVMLLDEPSNHLDMEGIEWFKEFVRTTDAAVVIVSHNRYLLDAVAEEIWEVRRSRVKTWTGNYTAFRSQKEKALELQERRYKTQQRLIERIEFQARRLKDMANAYDDPGQAKRAKAMLRRIERMDRVDRPDRAEDRFHASLKGGARHGRLALSIQDFTFHYEDRVLFDRASLELEYGDRVCLVGPNGSGKTTLVREILEHGDWENPQLRLGKSVKAGEYRQLHDVLDENASLLEWTSRVTKLAEPEAAKLLHRFLFAFDDLERPIGTLSGGEKSRLQLARLVHEKVNFLFLDEPTNHLDIQACEQLEEMLQEFDGTLFVISHDRYFLDKLVNRVVEVRDRKLDLFRGSFGEWWQSKHESREGRRKGALELHSVKTAADDEKARAREERDARKARQRKVRRLERKVQKIETRLEGLESRRNELMEALQNAYGPEDDPAEARALSDELTTVQKEIDDQYAAWERAATTLESS